MKKTTPYAVAAFVAVAALFTMPMTVTPSAAQTGPAYEPELVQYIRDVTSQIGTTTITEDKAGNVTTTNNVKLDGSTYIVHTTTRAGSQVLNDQTVYITEHAPGVFRIINPAQNMNVLVTDQESYTRGYPSQGLASSAIVLSDRDHADDGDTLILDDDYRGCSGNYATFTAAVDTTDDTYITWEAQPQFFAYCFLYQGFDYVKITHEGHNEISQSRESNIDMWNANGEGWYSVTVKAYYN